MAEEKIDSFHAKIKELAKLAKEKNVDKEAWGIIALFATSDVAHEVIGNTETVLAKMIETIKTCETEQEFLDTVFSWVGL